MFYPARVRFVVAMALCASCRALPPLPSQADLSARAEPSPEKDENVDRVQLSLGLGSRTVDDVAELDLDGDGIPDDKLGDQATIGLELATISRYGLGLELGGWYSLGSDTLHGPQDVNLDLSQVDLTLGARFTLPMFGRLLPFIGAGLDVIYWKLSEDGGQTSTHEDLDLGYYVHGGLNARVWDYFTLGFEVNGLYGTGDDLDSTSMVIILGVVESLE